MIENCPNCGNYHWEPISDWQQTLLIYSNLFLLILTYSTYSSLNFAKADEKNSIPLL